jgi:hypothetical protein
VSYSIEKRHRIYDNDHGFYWEVRQDGDGLGIEVLYNEGGKADKDQPPQAIPEDVAPLLAQALVAVAAEIKAERERRAEITAEKPEGR